MPTLAWLVAALLFTADFPYRLALPGAHYSFPRDHFEHEDYRTEWWYYTGNVQDAAGRRYGFELVFFRLGQRKDGPRNPSQWRLDDLYLAHAAVTDIAGRRFLYTERINRSGPGIAGADFSQARLWNGNWYAQWHGEKQTLSALADDFAFSFELEPVKRFVIHGVNGVSRKAAGEGRASHYVSFPRLRASGKITLDGVARGVSGQAWMDHEWFTEQLDPAQSGWDWFSVQLDDGTELMLGDLRRKDGSIDPYSSGTFIDRSGNPHHLTSADFQLRHMTTWTSPRTHARYPVEWRITAPSLHLDLDCQATLPNQELVTQDGSTSYWEGAVTYRGSHRGVGYLEMTGYDKPVNFHQVPN